MNKVPSTFKQYLAYSASAGSGKTFALSVRYLSLLFLGEAPSTILATTFTKKASAEMRERIIDSLRNLKIPKNRAMLEAISKETNISTKDILAKQPLVLTTFLESSNFIVTIDSFFTSILRSSSFEIGLEPEFVIRNRDKDIFDNIFLSELKRMGLLNSLVTLSTNISNGKFAKMLDLMETLYTLDPILPDKKISVKDIKSIESKIQDTRLVLVELLISIEASNRAIKNFVESDISKLFATNIFKWESLIDHSHYNKYLISYPDINILYLELRVLLKEWLDAKESIVLYNLFDLYSYYKNANILDIKSSNILDFKDASYFIYRLLYKTVSKEFIYFKIDSKFKHILLDEFQDTSTIQFLIFKPLIDEIFSVSKDEDFRSFFYVGDTKQSIYRFRGGVEELFDMVALKYEITVLPMDTNYRSGQSIVGFVNNLFSNKIKNYTEQKFRDNANLGFVEVVEVESDAILLTAIDKAKELILKGISLNDITFLVSTNDVGEMLHNLCRLHNIDTILGINSSLKNIGKIASIIAVIKYLFYNQNPQYSAYKSAFLENIDIDENDIDFSWFNSYMKPFDIIDRLVDSFGYFNKDLNILKLLDFASKYSDIPSFLDDFENNSIDVASNTIHGASIMTTHKSKGLEFHTVIVLDRLKNKPNDLASILIDFDNDLFVKNISYRIAERYKVDDNYKSLLENRKKLSEQDELNLLYVSLTRAIDNLIVIKKEKKSAFDAIDLKPLQIGSIFVKPKDVIDECLDKENIHLPITHYGEQNIKQEKEKSDTKDYMAITFGLAMHYTLEMMDNFTEDDVSNAIESSKNHYGLVLEDSIWLDIETRVRKLVNNKDFKSMLKSAKFYKEKSISFNGKLKQIDLLLEYEESYLVIDYKSSNKNKSKDKSQVTNYINAIKDITNKDTKGAIVYLLQDNIEIIYL